MGYLQKFGDSWQLVADNGVTKFAYPTGTEEIYTFSDGSGFIRQYGDSWQIQQGSTLAFAYPTDNAEFFITAISSSGGGGGGGDIPDITITNCRGESVNITGNRKKWAVSIYNSAQELGLSDDLTRRAGIAGLMTALVESVLLMYANSNVPESLNYPHDAVGSDHDSCGLMQQRPSSGWGTVAELMNANYNAAAFYGGPNGPNNGSPAGLLDKNGWETGDLGAWCQAVQGSAFPDRYACWQNGAETLYDHIAEGGGTGGSGFAWPFSLANSNWKNGEPEDNFKTPQRPNHQGMDFGYGSAHNGANMPASNSGTVYVSGPYYGYGNTVIIDHGSVNGKNVKTLYGHMQDGSLTKNVGEAIARGETMGKVGNTGQSRGAHLHFETWVNNVKIDPIIFMNEHNPTNTYIVE